LTILLDNTVARGLEGLNVPEPLKLSEWMDENFYISPESSSITGAWVTFPYQKAILNAMSNDDIKVVTLMKPKRTGFTKMLCGAIGYFAEHKKRNVVLWQPTDTDSDDFVKDEIDPMLRDVPVLRTALKCNPDKKSPYNTLSKKCFNGSTVDLRGGNSPRGFRRMTKDVAIYDELSAFDSDIGKEGSSVILGDGRLENSPFPKSIRGSTPKILGECQIEKSYDEADLKFTRQIPCPECGQYDALTFSRLNWTDKDFRTTKMSCQRDGCGALFGYNKFSDLEKKGRWVAEDGEWIDDDDQFRSKDGDVIDAPYHIGFRIWAAYSYFRVWSDIVREFINANKLAKKGDDTSLKTFVNTTLAETYTESGETADPSALYKRREHYSKVPNQAKVLTCFIDVQDDRFEGEITAWGAGEESWAIDYFRLYGNIGLQQIWSTLGDKIRKTYTKEDGSLIDISVTGIDSGHYTDEVYNFSKKIGVRRVIPTKGSSEYGRPIANFPKKRNSKGVYLTMIGTDTAKELIYGRYEVQEVGAGYCHHPINDDFDEDYFKQATAEEKLKKYKKGVMYYFWDAKKRRNEVLDCKVGNLAMVRILQQHFGLNLELTPQKKQKPKKQSGGWMKNVDNWIR